MSIRQSYLARRAFLGGGLAVTAVGAVGVPALAASHGAARPRPAAPEIATTADWGAREPQGSIEVLDSAPSQIIVHHTAGDNSEDTSQEHAFEISRQIQDSHMDGNGWTDTGQNFTNSRGGWVTEGRHGSLDALTSGTQHVVGAHAGDQNSVALGIENEGLYTDVDVPDELWQQLVELCSYMVTQYGIDPGEIYGHRDFMSTECPGEVLYGRLPELREAVGAATGLRVVHPLTWPLLKPGATGPTVSAVQYLLRAQGNSLPVDGAFRANTQRVAGAFAADRRATGASCYGTRIPEPGLFGGSAWTELAPVLTAGSQGDAVRAAQILLVSRGRYAATDGRFGQRMTSTVREFQASHGVAVDGAVNHQTWKLLLR